jgi:hypothetical protein
VVKKKKSKCEEIACQLQKLEDDADVTAAQNFRIAEYWEARNMYLGFSIVFVSGIVTVIGAVASINELDGWQPYFTSASTILAAIATAIGSVLTFLKPSERGAKYREFGNKQKALRNRIRIYKSVKMEENSAEPGPSAQLSAFCDEKDTLISDNPPLFHWAYQVAKREILERQQKRKDEAAKAAKVGAATSPLSGG